MAYWDVFHTARLEAERSLTTEAVRQAIARGDLLPDDLVRPAGQTNWQRISESDTFGPFAPPPATAQPPTPPDPEPEPAPESIYDSFEIVDDDEDDDVYQPQAVPPDNGGEFTIDPDAFASMDREEIRRAESDAEEEFEVLATPKPNPKPRPETKAAVPQRSNEGAMPVLLDEETQRGELDELDDPIPDIDFTEYDPQDEDEAAAEFTLSRNAPETVEELDLAAMVDVAFQLVLFFLVTAQVVLFKTLEVPRPNEDKPPDAAVQAKTKSVDELEKDYILVEVDAAGNIKIDRQPVAANRPLLVETLRKSREDTQRKAMLLSADFATRHEHAVLVFDVANEIDLKIAIAQPAAKK